MGQQSVNPLTWNAPIVDPKTGFPTPEFQRKWAQQAAVNAGVNSPQAPGTVLANITSSNNSPVGSTLSAILDFIFGKTQGVILFRGASIWQTLSPGTAGQFLTTGGSGANPTWTTGLTTTVSGLGTPTAGRWGFVTDSNATLAAGLGNVVAGAGANFVPVYADGSAWRIG